MLLTAGRGKRLYYVTNRCEIGLPDTQGFKDGEKQRSLQGRSLRAERCRHHLEIRMMEEVGRSRTTCRIPHLFRWRFDLCPCFQRRDENVPTFIAESALHIALN